MNKIGLHNGPVAKGISLHQLGRAADIYVSGITDLDVIEAAAKSVGFTEVIPEPTQGIVHVGIK